MDEMQKECTTNFTERCQRSVIVNRVNVQESVLVRTRFLDMPRNAKVASVGTSRYLARHLVRAYSNLPKVASSMTDWSWRVHI